MIEMEVMLAEKLPAQRFLRLGEMMQICAGIPGTGRTVALGIQLILCKLVNSPAQLKVPTRGKRPTPLCHLRGDDAVEHIHAAMNRFQDIQRRPYPHHVAWQIGWHEV